MTMIWAERQALAALPAIERGSSSSVKAAVIRITPMTTQFTESVGDTEKELRDSYTIKLNNIMTEGLKS